MPSKALGKFEGAMMKDVNSIFQTHGDIQNGNPGNMGLGHASEEGGTFVVNGTRFRKDGTLGKQQDTFAMHFEGDRL